MRQAVGQPVQPSLPAFLLGSLARDLPCSRRTPCRSAALSDPGGTSLPSHYGISVPPTAILTPWAPAMRSFRGSIARPPVSLCTLRASVAADYATLASGRWPAFAVPPFQATGFVQSISLFLNTSFDYGLFTAPKDVSPGTQVQVCSYDASRANEHV